MNADELKVWIEGLSDEGLKKTIEGLPTEEAKIAFAEVVTDREGQVAKTMEALRKEREASKEGKAKLTRLEELEKAESDRKKQSLDEIEKAKLEAQEAKDEKAKAEAERDAQKGKAKAIALKSQVAIEASKLDFADPNDVMKLADFGKVEFNEEADSYDEAEIKKVLEALAKSKPYLLKDAKSAGSRNGSPRHEKTSQGGSGGEKKNADVPSKPLVKL